MTKSAPKPFTLGGIFDNNEKLIARLIELIHQGVARFAIPRIIYAEFKVEINPNHVAGARDRYIKYLEENEEDELLASIPRKKKALPALPKSVAKLEAAAEKRRANLKVPPNRGGANLNLKQTVEEKRRANGNGYAPELPPVSEVKPPTTPALVAVVEAVAPPPPDTLEERIARAPRTPISNNPELDSPADQRLLQAIFSIGAAVAPTPRTCSVCSQRRYGRTLFCEEHGKTMYSHSEARAAS